MSYLVLFYIMFVGVRYTISDFASYRTFIAVFFFDYYFENQPQHTAVNPLASLSLLQPRLILPFLHLSPIAGIRGAATGISPPRRSPPLVYSDTQMHVIAGLEIRVLSALFYRREGGLFVCFFRRGARVLRRHPGSACTVACLRARAADVVAEVCQTVTTSASPRIICSKS